MMVDKKRDSGQLNCFQKLELLSERLKDLARIMTEMKEGLQRKRAAGE
ncbi:MAG: hypothetical protein HUJ29_05350 [Gammaproteobacteria bacterium]|nr:hypothetical protein [Gammaproteobacteria bacterium]